MLNKKRFLSYGLSVIACSSLIMTGSIINKKDTEVRAETVNQMDLSKEELQNKMINSIDYFDSAKGTYRYFANHSNTDYTVDFQVKIKDTPSSYTRIRTKEKNDFETSFDGKNYLRKNNSKKTYEKYVIDEDNSRNTFAGSTSQNRYIKDEKNKTIGVKLRKDPSHMETATEILFNQNIALGFLEDYSKWDIKEEINYLGFNATVVSGELNDYYKIKHEGETFKLWVNTETGILLKMEEYNASGKVVYLIEATDLKINTSLDKSKFKLSPPADYKEIKN